MMSWTPPIYSDAGGATIVFPFNRFLKESLYRAVDGVYLDPAGGYRLDGADARSKLEAWAASVEFEGPVADDRGRDAYARAPIASPYVRATDDEILITTPWHRGIKSRLKMIAGSLWDQPRQVWIVPYRCAEALIALWPQIEALAQSQEPEQKQKAREEKQARNKPWRLEARRHRLLVKAGDEPPPNMLFVPRLTNRVAIVNKYSEVFADKSNIYQYIIDQDGPFRLVYYRLANKDEVMTSEHAVPPDRRSGWRSPGARDKAERLHQISCAGLRKRKPSSRSK